MPCGKIIGEDTRSLNATTADERYEWYTSWLSATGMDEIKTVLKLRNLNGNFQCKHAIQVAPVRTDKPDAPEALGSYVTTNSEACSGLYDLSGTINDQYFIRFGVMYNLSSGTFGRGDVTYQCSYAQCGQVLGATSVQLETSSTTEKYQVLTGWLPAIMAKKVMLAVVCASRSGNIQWRAAYRTATTSPEIPSAWSTTFDANGYRADGEFNTGEITPTVANEMWVQFGLQYNLSSGSALGTAAFQVSTAVRR